MIKTSNKPSCSGKEFTQLVVDYISQCKENNVRATKKGLLYKTGFSCLPPKYTSLGFNDYLIDYNKKYDIKKGKELKSHFNKYLANRAQMKVKPTLEDFCISQVTTRGVLKKYGCYFDMLDKCKKQASELLAEREAEKQAEITATRIAVQAAKDRMKLIREANKANPIDSRGSKTNDNEIVGNYWDNYTGFDRDGDNVGDTPHKVFQYADQLWIYNPDVKFFYGSPVISLLNFLAKLAPFSKPLFLLEDEKPKVKIKG